MRRPVPPTLAIVALLASGRPGTGQEPGPTADPAIGRLYQIMDAVPLRGEEIRLRVALRVSPGESRHCVTEEPEPSRVAAPGQECESSAFGWLRIDGQPAAGPGPEARTARIGADGWSMEEVRTRVPEDALDLLFGVALEGDGPMWADDLQLAVLRDNDLWRSFSIPNGEFEIMGDSGRPARWGGLDPGWDARIDRNAPYEGSGAVRLTRSPARSD